MAIKIPNEFDLKQQVYVITDPDQNIHIITAIIVLPGSVMYRAACGGEDADYYDFELSLTPRVF